MGVGGDAICGEGRGVGTGASVLGWGKRRICMMSGYIGIDLLEVCGRKS